MEKTYIRLFSYTQGIMKDIESVIGFEALYNAMMKCKKGVLWKDSTASYYLHGIERNIKLSKELHDGTYRAKPTVKFKVTSPKPREIASISFRDRVYQRSLNDNILYPAMTKSFIYDNFACQKGKGTDAARDRLGEFLRKYYRKHGHIGYVAQFDIKGYYPNMSHRITEETFQKKLLADAFERTKTILRGQYEGEVGYNPGSQMIQIAGISLLDGMDHYIKEQLHIKYYIRYMDDFILIHESEEYLQQCKDKIVDYLKRVECTINEKKTRIYLLSEGIPFLGFHFYVTNTGKVMRLIKPENVKRERKKLRRLVDRSLKGLIPKCKVDESYAAWRNHASKGNTWNLLQRMDVYYKNLWSVNRNDISETYNEHSAE